METRMRRPALPGRWDAAAALAAIAAALVLQATTRLSPTAPDWFDGLTLPAAAGLVLVLAPLAYRRVAPGWAAAAYQPAFLLLPTEQSWSTVVAGLAGLVLLLDLALRCAPRVSLPIALASVALQAGARSDPGLADTLTGLAVTGGLWLAGWSVRRRRLRRAALVRAAVAAERARIAHELNDLVAHQVLGVVVQAGAGGGADALAGIEATAREALAAMRRMLRVLRGPADLPEPAGADRWPGLGDWALAALPLLLSGGPAGWSAEVLPDPAWRSGALAAVAVVAVLLRRRAPAALLLVAAAAQVGYEAGGGDQVVTGTAVLLGAYAAGAWSTWRRSVPATVVAMAVLGGTALAGVPGGVDRAGIVVAVPLATAAGLAARALRRRRDRRRRGEDRAAVDVERAGLARELHDVVAHHLSGIVVQAGAARLLPAAAAGPALAEIAVAARAALAGLRQLLDLAGGDGALTPQPGLAELGGLLEAARAAGLDVRADVRAGFGPELELFAHRVVQESLTNCVKHAAGARVSVRVGPDGGDLLVRVADDGGRGASGVPRSDPGGYGLAGMAERVALLGGTLTAGRAGGGWTVEARVPVPARTEESRWASVS